MTGTVDRVLVTGGCGYIGAQLCKFLSEKGYRITVFDNEYPDKYPEWINLMEEVIIGDITDYKTIQIFEELDVDVLIHMISLDHNKSKLAPSLVSSINVTPTWSLLERLSKRGLKKSIYFSSIHVYGNNLEENINEDFLPSPINAYGLTHMLSEKICNYYNKTTSTYCINVRLSNSYGSPVFKENNCWWLVINDLCKMAIEIGEIRLLSDGSPMRDFIHGSDICRAIETLIKQEKKQEKNTFNIVSGKPFSIIELAHIVKRVYKAKYNIDIPVFLGDGKLSEIIDDLPLKKPKYDNLRISSLGFKPLMSIENGIDEILSNLYADR